METETVREKKFLKDRARLSQDLASGAIDKATYDQRLKEIRTSRNGPLPLGLIVENIEYNASCMKSTLFHAAMARDHKAQLRDLETTLTETVANLSSLIEDIRTLMKYDAPHILLELDTHPCIECIVFNQLEPMKRHEGCEGCEDLEDRDAWEADKHPYYDGIEAG